MLTTLKNAFKMRELRKKILFTLSKDELFTLYMDFVKILI